jgi:uncharacterized membrane protein
MFVLPLTIYCFTENYSHFEFLAKTFARKISVQLVIFLYTFNKLDVGKLLAFLGR